jgi:signal transduction histidine kinase
MKLATQISLGFLIAISIDMIDSYANYSLTRKVNTNMAFLSNSEAIIRTSSDLNREIVEMQNALRGFLLTGDDKFLGRYNSGLASIPALIKQEQALVRPTPIQLARLDSIAAIHNEWLGYAGLVIGAKSQAVTNPSLTGKYQQLFLAQFKLNAGKNYNQRIDNIFRSFDRYEYHVRETRRGALAASIHQTDRSSLFFSVVLVLSSSGVAFYLVRKIARRIRSMVKVAENISRGDFTLVYDDKKDELTNLSLSLNLMSQKLNRNISQLEKKNDELNQFAHVVSHDLKAPIRGISNVVQWIKEDLTDEISPNMQNYLDIIRERLKRMGSLIDGLLEYARIGRSSYAKEEVDVAALVKDLGELLVPEGYTLAVGKLPVLVTEKILLEQVFGNLLSNAVRYTSPGNAHIAVNCTERENFYEFSVTDNGIGIDEEYHEKIFGMFQTLREKHDKESTGIGLAIVKKIIHEIQGTIMVISSLNNGASFVFTWPKN